MKVYRFKLLFLIACLGFLFQSCSEEETQLELEGNLTEELLEARKGRPGGGGPGGNPNGTGGANTISAAQYDSETLSDWLDLFIELDRYATGMRPNATARALAYINMAAYETALPKMPNYISNSEMLQGLRMERTANADNINVEIALNVCYADVIDHFLLHLPTNKRAKISENESGLKLLLEIGVPDRVIADSETWGRSVARQIIAFSQTDRQAERQILEPQPASYEPPVADGYWTYSAVQERALFPYWGTVRTFAIHPDQTTAEAPIRYSENENSEYFQQMKEVLDLNDKAKAEDNEDLWIAEFWSDDVENLVFSPPTRQISIANQLIGRQGLNLEESLYLMLKLSIALNDAAVSTWKYKYEFMVMRPNVYIHEFMDENFQTNLYRLVPWPNPTFPGYPSGHSCFASAAGGVFIDIFGERANFTDRSHQGREEFRSTPRHFETFEEMASENAFSRVPLGVHMRMDCTEGLRLGYEISDAVNEYNLYRPGI